MTDSKPADELKQASPVSSDPATPSVTPDAPVDEASNGESGANQASTTASQDQAADPEIANGSEAPKKRGRPSKAEGTAATTPPADAAATDQTTADSTAKQPDSVLLSTAQGVPVNPLLIQVINNGKPTHEYHTNTLLNTGVLTDIVCHSVQQKATILRNFVQLNELANGVRFAVTGG